MRRLSRVEHEGRVDRDADDLRLEGAELVVASRNAHISIVQTLVKASGKKTSTT